MSEILSRKEFDRAQSGSVTHQIPHPVLATIEALAEALDVAIGSDWRKIRDHADAFATLRDKGWLE